MARTRHSNLGDHPGHTTHGPHHGMKISAHGRRARGGPAGNGGVRGESPTHRPNGRGLGIHSGSADDDSDDYDDGGRVHLQRGGRGDRVMRGHTDSGLSDTGSRDLRGRINQYNAQGSPAMKTAVDETPGFQRGGRKRAHRRDGGTATGATAAPRMDHARRQAGGSAPGNRTGKGVRTPYSSGSSLSPPADDRPGRGYEGGPPA